MSARRLGICSVLVLCAFGCSHQLDDPRPALASLTPNLVCAAQRTTAVTVSGTNLTPIPTKTLSGGEVLAAPTVTLTEASDLVGAPMSSAAIRLNDATDPSSTHVRWESEQQMSFDVTPELQLSPGVYDVTLANPDGKSATLSQALGVVPPPSVTAVMPMSLCDAQAAAMVQVAGQGFLVVGGVGPEVDVYDGSGVPLLTAMATASDCSDAAAQLGAMIEECTTLTFSVPAGALPVGSYTLRVTNPAPAGCQSSEAVGFTVEPPPVLDDVVPATICAGGGTLDLHGMGFLPTATASLADPATGQSVDATSTTVNAAGTDAVGHFLVGGSGFTVGDQLDVSIRNHDGCLATLPMKVTVTQGPIIFNVDPAYVHAGDVTPVTVYTTGGITKLNAVTLTPSATPNAPPVAVTAAIDAAHPSHVIVDVPASLPAGAYDLTIDNQADCPAFFARAITVVAQSTAVDIAPRFGASATDTPVTITAATSFFEGGARAWLAPHGATTPAVIAIQSVVYQSANELSGLVRAPIAVGGYDLVVVNPSGTVGFKASAFTVVGGPVPTIDPASPGSLPASCASSASCTLSLAGTNFDATNPSSDVVSATCTTVANATSNVTTPIVGQPTATAIALDLTNAAALGAGTTCTFHLTQTVAGVSVFVDGGTLVVRNPAANLSAPSPGMPLVTARQGHGLAYSGPTASARYLYVVGGDAGTTTYLDSVELAKVDPARGGTSAWTQLPIAGAASAMQGKLPTARTQLGLVAVGRFLYAVGGLTSGSTATRQVLRAESLDPAEAPSLTDADLTPDATAGVAAGLYFYRVAALLGAGDSLNPSGETLASDELAIVVPAFGAKKLDVTLVWTKPASLGARTVAKWRIYRTSAANSAPGSEDEYADVDGATLSIVDTGASVTVPGPSPTMTSWAAGKPLPFGAIGNWATAGAQLGTARAGAGVAHVVVPTPSPGTGTTDLVYVGYGGDGSTLPVSYDAFTVTGASSNAPVETALAGGALVAARGRWQLGAFGVTPDVDPAGGGDFVYFGSGNGTAPASAGAGTAVTGFDRCSITTASAGFGALVCSGTGLGSIGPNNQNLWGYGAGTVADSLFLFGGTGAGGLSDKIGTSPDTATPNFTANGGGSIQSGGASFPVAFLGTTIGGAYFWLAGGASAAGVTNKTFYVLY